jgi:hypothetical protein
MHAREPFWNEMKDPSVFDQDIRVEDAAQPIADRNAARAAEEAATKVGRKSNVCLKTR